MSCCGVCGGKDTDSKEEDVIDKEQTKEQSQLLDLQEPAQKSEQEQE